MRRSQKDAGHPILTQGKKTIYEVAIAALVAFVLGAAGAAQSDLVWKNETKVVASDRQSALRLILQTKKRVYRASDPIHVRAYLENTSEDQTFYVGRELGGFCAIVSFHYIELRVTDQKNRRIPIANSAGAAGWKEGTTQREIIETEYVPLGPKSIYGQTETCEIRLKKGRYRMRAVYYEFEATDWKNKEALDFPVWTKTLYSNVVTITVIP